MLTSGLCQGGLCFYCWTLAENQKKSVCRSHILGKNRLHLSRECQSEVICLVLGARIAFDLLERDEKVSETQKLKENAILSKLWANSKGVQKKTGAAIAKC